jgi:cob(I)alamin adenosyltransferase
VKRKIILTLVDVDVSSVHKIAEAEFELFDEDHARLLLEQIESKLEDDINGIIDNVSIGLSIEGKTSGARLESAGTALRRLERQLTSVQNVTRELKSP